MSSAGLALCLRGNPLPWNILVFVLCTIADALLELQFVAGMLVLARPMWPAVLALGDCSAHLGGACCSGPCPTGRLRCCSAKSPSLAG